MYTSLIKRLIVACFVLLSSQLNSQVGGACTDLSGIDFGPCDLFLGYGLINGQCVSISGCSTVDVTSGADYAFAIYPNLSQCLPCQVEACQDLSNLDFGPCDLELGFYWNGTQCLSISGCSTTASNGIDYANAIHPSQEACEANCGPGCIDLSGIDFGGCALVLGYYWNGTGCQVLSGCSTISSQGVDYSNHIYPSPEACESECGSGCVDLSNVDFGLCLAVLGYAAGPNGCQSYSGCSHIGADGYDYSDQFYGSLVACQVACGENCIDLAGIDFGPCDAILGFAQINGQCVEISGCSPIGNDGVDYSAWIYNSAEQCENVCTGCVDPSQIDLNFPCPEIYDPVCGCDGVTYGNSCEATYYGGVTSYTSGPCPNACTDVAGIDFGPCLAVLGWANINGDCVLISGCSTTGDDGINYSAAFHNTLGECAAACGATCLDLDGLFFGYCEAILGWAYINGSCQIVSGCSTTADDGYNYAAWFYASEAECYAACGDDCYDPSQVDLTFPCPEIYDPVCGCDGVTYDNSCYATYYGGVQSYTSGACPGPCTDVAGVDFGLCLAILGWANVNGVCVLISGCSTTGDDGINYAAAFHSSLGECLAACGGVCVDLSGVDFGPCDAILGWTSTPEGCVAISGCSLVVNGVDYSPWVFVSEADCSSECGDDCYDPNLIDPNILCPEIYDPVCGCDGNTYENSCVAQYVYGISSWTSGPCPEPCIDPNLIDPNAICPDVYDPVCGCDGVTYTNACEATYYGGVTSYIDGPCCEPCIIEENIDPDPICIALYDPVCGCDGITYSNSCYAAAAGLTSWTGGPCPCIDPDLVDPNAVCPDVWDPVCGCDGQTYGNICEAQAAGVTSWTAGECPCPNPDAINPNVLCIALYDPVCGCDGETYQNECIALNHYGITSWTDGPCPCEGEPDPDAICPDVWDPVCGCDGETYGNACEAAAAGVSTWTDGPCPCLDPDAVVDDPICPEVYDPVCGCNGLTYDNSCYASAAGILSWTDGECPCVNPDAIDFVVLCAPVDDPVCGCDGITYLNSCFAHYYAGLSSWTDGPCPCQGEPDPDAICPDVWDPVCGCDGQTYGNSCEAEAAGLSSWTDGPCPCVDPDAIVVDPVCPEIYDPVCGCNGLTYDNSCYAQAAGLNSWTEGPCPCPNPDLVNGNVLCVNLYDPVCGCDGVTYLNSCVAQFHHGISSWTDGECPCQGLPDPDAICPDIWDPVCGCNGITYGNACEADAAGLSSWIDGPCPNECIDPDLIDPTIVCAGTYDPVCGCDGVTYDNSCIAQYYNGVSDWTPGVCPDECIDPTLIDPNPTCTEEYVPVCGCDGITYSNDCYAQAAGVTYWTDGECPCQVAPDPNQICPAIFDPVCGCDGQTYGNACEADAAGITSWTDGPCPCPNPALIDPDAICPEIYDPVCGCDGASYGNSCEAEAAGVYDYTPGDCPCQVDPDPNQICPDVWDPVCGCDGLTYGNSCEADAAGITSWSDGECPCQGTPDPDQICPLIFDPVCGCDGQTYSNACFADKAGLASWVDGPCPCPNPDLIDPDAICPEIYDPVCGCDNVTYGNSCEAEAAGVYDYSSGECPCQVDPDPNQICPDVWDPVCGCDGLTYGNSCEADAAGITSWSDGECPCQGTPDPDQICPLIFDPVCGCDGQTYSNACFADKAGLASWIDGPCPCPNPDLIDPDAICPEIYDPVCGCDNVTYGNSCEAEAAGVYDYSSGECPCQVDPDPNQICPDVWDPVCGCDGQTYGNSCEADAAGITSWTEGECPCQGTPDPNQICPAVFDPVCGCDGQTYGNACEADAAGITSWIDGPCPEDSDGDGVPDDEDCEPNDPLVYQGGPCDDGNPNTTGDIYDDCCNCIGTPVNCDDSDPCTIDFYSEFAGCVSFDISIASVSVNEVHFCENGVYYASLEVTVNNPDYGGFIVIGDTYFPVMSDVQIVQYTLIWDGNAPVVWRSIDDHTGGLICGVPLPVDDIIAACPASCPTDIDQNGVTNTVDLLLFLGGFGQVCD